MISRAPSCINVEWKQVMPQIWLTQNYTYFKQLKIKKLLEYDGDRFKIET